MKTTFRYGIATKRLCDAYNQRVLGTSQIQRTSGVVMLIDTGRQSTISGSGPVFENFQWTGVIESFTGHGLNPTQFTHPNSDAALL